MAEVTLEKVLEEVGGLTPEEVLRLWGALRSWFFKHYRPSLDMVLEEVKALSPEEQAELWKTLQLLLTAYSRPSEDEFERALSALGVLGEIGQPRDEPPRSEVRPVITLEGKPVSEQIIEERR